MASSNLKLSDTSYTNKEFQEIYPELLEKARDLSYKWDPTVSNESDPGVTLIKEIAIALDKINYASDKNAMETMPLSVTQERTARQLFQLLGYYPKWYISAEADVSMAWKVDQDSEEYEALVNSGEMVKIPAFTEIRDDSGDYVYTIPTTTFLKSNGSVEVVKAIQGVVKDLKINNTTIITLDLINQNNRVYFPDYNVAQNGVFVMNKDAADSGEVNERSFWEQKDNLYVEEPGNRYYSFNIDIPTNRCYIEFPSDISDLIGGGLVIKYLVTTGRDGNSAVGQLNQLYDSSISASYVLSPDTTITMDSDNLYIQNTSLEVTGKDPESIDDMYRNYNRIKGTFDTIVTLRDYNNALYNTGEVSNGVVTDRTNDQQQAYRIMASTLDDSENVVYMPQAKSIEKYAEDRLHPFALKVYALQYAEVSDSASESENKKSYDKTFELFVDMDVENPFNIDSTLLQLTQLLNDERCIQHDFSDIQPNKICLIKNIAEASLMVFPTVQLTELQKQNVIDSIKNQIYKKYNSREREFGQGVDYDTLFTDILTSDALIKNVSLNQVQYYTYAMYYSQGEGNGIKDGWKEICVSDEYDYIKLKQMSETEFLIDGQNTEPGEKGSNVFFILDGDYPTIYVTDENKKLVLYSKKRQEFRNEILAKNILAGVTPLFITGNKHKFSYAADEDNSSYFPAVSDVDMYTSMEFSFQDGQSSARYYPKENEVIQFVRPQLTQSLNYGSYVKYDWTGRTVQANQNHQMVSDETLVLYYKTEDSDESPYTRVVYGQDSGSFPIISPTFNLERTTRHAEKLSDPRMVPTSVLTIRSGQSISIKEKNEVKLDKNNYLYVVGDEIEKNSEKYYQLAFQKDYIDEQNRTHYSVTLQGEQQVIYAQDSLAYLNIVGSGTKITIITGENESLGDVYYFENKVVSLSKISRFGVSALQGYWKKISSTLPGCQVIVLAQEFINVQGSVSDSGEVRPNVDSYVEISSNAGMPSGVSMVLDRDGLKYETQSSSTSYVRSAKGTLAYLDDNNQNQYADITSSQINSTKLFEFLNGDYGWQNDDETSTVTFVPKDYVTTSLTVAINQEQTTVSGYKTTGWTADGKSYYFLISRSVLYLIEETDLGPICRKIDGYCTGTNSDGNYDEYQLKRDPENPGSYIFNDSSVRLPARKTIVLLDVSDENNKLYLPGQSLQSNDTDTTQDIQPFSIPTDVTIENGVVTNVKAIIANFWKIDDVTLDYNTSLPEIRPVYNSLSGTTQIQLNPLDGQIVITCSNVAYDGTRKKAVRLTKTSNTYRNNGGGYETCHRYWEYTNNDNLTSLIKSSDLKEIYDFYAQDLPSNFNQWQWPIDGAAIQIIANQDKIGADDPVNPSLYSFTYRNRGGEEETIVLDDQTDIGWSVYGLAYLDSSNTSPQKIYENQELTIYTEDGDPQIITKEENKDTYVYSSDELYVEGYKKQNLQMIDKNGNLYYPSILASKAPENQTDYSRDIDDKIIHITLNSGNKMYNLEFTDLPSGEYVFKIVNRFSIDKLRLRVPDDGSMTCLNLDYDYDTVYDMADKGVYYYKVTATNGTTSLPLHVYLQGEQRADILIYPMKPIEHPDDSPLGDPLVTSNVLSLIKELATYDGKDMFNYLYEPRGDKMIINPLRSESFNNVNHFYNHCTICKVRTYDVLGDSNIFISQ